MLLEWMRFERHKKQQTGCWKHHILLSCTEITRVKLLQTWQREIKNIISKELSSSSTTDSSTWIWSKSSSLYPKSNILDTSIQEILFNSPFIFFLSCLCLFPEFKWHFPVFAITPELFLSNLQRLNILTEKTGKMDSLLGGQLRGFNVVDSAVF